MESIELIEDIKSELGIVGDCSDVQLMEKLSKARKSSHPDSFKDPKVKEEKEEQFKKLNNLFDEFKKYLEKKRAEMLPAKFEEVEESFNLMQKISEITSLQDENRILTVENNSLKQTLNSNEVIINELENTDNTQKETNINLSLKDIYKLKKETSFTIISLTILLVTQLKIIKTELSNILGMDNHSNAIIISVLSVFLILSLVGILYKVIIKNRIDYNMKKLTNPGLIANISLRSNKRYYTNNYFIEKDLYDYIESMVSKFDSYIFLFQKEIIYREFVNYIILILNKKRIIKRTYPEGLDLYFELNDDFRRY